MGNSSPRDPLGPPDPRGRHRRAAATDSAPAAAPPAGPDRARLIAWAIALATAAALVAIAIGPHRVGDYYTETDFYGGYATGARLFQAGTPDAGRYGVVGPGFDAALALVGSLTRDLFVAGEAIAIAGALATLLFSFELLRRRANDATALWATALLAANATFFHHGYCATTDSLALALQSAALFCAFGARRALAPLLAGALLALAALTRYTAVALLPVTLLVPLFASRGAGRWRTPLLHLAGFALVAAPALIGFARAGHWPGEMLFHNVAYDVFASGQGRSLADYQQGVQPGLHSLGDVLGRDPLAIARRWGANALSHLAGDARELLGLPAAALCAIGLIVVLVEGTWRPLLPLGLSALALYLSLVPAPAAARYSLVLAPFYMALAGAAAGTAARSRWLRAGPSWLRHAAGLAVLALSLGHTVRAQRESFALLPLEVRGAARALAADGGGGACVMALKPHVAYLANARFVPLPAAGLTGAASTAAYGHVTHLYYSWIEADNRPELWYLLDPATSVPGLAPIWQSADHAAVLWRIGPGFGAIPAWLGSPGERAAAQARFVSRMPASLAWRAHVSLAVWAQAHALWPELRAHAQAALAGQPDLALAWRLLGEAQSRQGQRDAAIGSFERSLELEPESVDARVILGWMLVQAGRSAEAERAWAPVAGSATDSTTLARMVALFGERGNTAAGAAARAALARRAKAAP